jgi:hypothetical protein
MDDAEFPLAEELKGSIGTRRALPIQRGLARIDGPQGMIVAYATQGAGQALLRYLEGGDEVTTMFKHIAADVFTATNHRQRPELSLSAISDIFLRGHPGEGGFLAGVGPATGRCVRGRRGTMAQHRGDRQQGGISGPPRALFGCSASSPGHEWAT